MNFQSILLLCLTFFLTNPSLASIIKANEKAKLLEELTGQKPKISSEVKSNENTVSNTIPSDFKASRSQMHLNAGFQAFTRKDYIKALKHYNTVIVNHSNSPEVKSAYLAKAKLYQEMGLFEQAQLNVKLANEFEKKMQTTN
jgi:hypothetical protein